MYVGTVCQGKLDSLIVFGLSYSFRLVLEQKIVGMVPLPPIAQKSPYDVVLACSSSMVGVRSLW